MEVVHDTNSILDRINYYSNLQRRYRRYPGSPLDSGIFQLSGCYTVRDERRYISNKLKMFKEGLKFLQEHKLTRAGVTWTGRWVFPK